MQVYTCLYKKLNKKKEMARPVRICAFFTIKVGTVPMNNLRKFFINIIWNVLVNLVPTDSNLVPTDSNLTYWQ